MPYRDRYGYDDHAEDYLRRRLARMDRMYKDSWPRWSNDDYCAVNELLQRVVDSEREEPQGAETAQ